MATSAPAKSKLTDRARHGPGDATPRSSSPRESLRGTGPCRHRRLRHHRGGHAGTDGARFDAKLQRGDTLVVAALDRVGRRSIDVMGVIFDLVNRGVRLRSLADAEAWAKGLDADPDSMEWMSAILIAQVCSFAAQLERQAIARRTKSRARERARAEGKRVGRPPALAEETLSAIQPGRGGGDAGGCRGPQVRRPAHHAHRPSGAKRREQCQLMSTGAMPHSAKLPPLPV